MKNLFLAILFATNFSCDTISQELTEENADTSYTEQASANPGEIIMNAKVVEVYNSNKDICGISQKNVLKIEVDEIIQRGSSIVNMPHKGNQLLVNFVIEPKDMSPEKKLELKAKESLCQEASKTYFTVISYKILE
jgi:hypothetical protein